MNNMPTWLTPKGFDALLSLDLNKDEMSVCIVCAYVCWISRVLMKFQETDGDVFGDNLIRVEWKIYETLRMFNDD